jgi:AmmeMemoRadiSam system protein B
MEKENITIRKPAFAGSFYPSTKKEIHTFFQRFEEQLEEENLEERKGSAPVSGIIVPHAGWVYSGKTAYAAHRLLQKAKPEKIALLGPSHRALFHTAYRDPHDFWESPLGRTPILPDSRFPVHPTVHDEEHSLEVQLPFIQYFHPDSRVLPLVVGHISETQANEFARLLDSYFLIISTDLSHYHPLDEARHIDSRSIQNIENLDDRDVDACGINPLRIAFAFMRQRGLRPHLIDYSTSAEAFGDASAVVGYAGFWF